MYSRLVDVDATADNDAGDTSPPVAAYCTCIILICCHLKKRDDCIIVNKVIVQSWLNIIIICIYYSLPGYPLACSLVLPTSTNRRRKSRVNFDILSLSIVLLFCETILALFSVSNKRDNDNDDHRHPHHHPYQSGWWWRSSSSSFRIRFAGNTIPFKMPIMVSLFNQSKFICLSNSLSNRSIFWFIFCKNYGFVVIFFVSLFGDIKVYSYAETFTLRFKYLPSTKHIHIHT